MRRLFDFSMPAAAFRLRSPPAVEAKVANGRVINEVNIGMENLLKILPLTMTNIFLQKTK